jgi:uncharacterized membrane protein HdeD (DUF308 family)
MSDFTYNPLAAGIEKVRRSWGWFLALGILLVILGVVCIAFDVSATFATVYVFGWLLLIGGVIALVQSFTTGTWSGFFIFLLTALFRGFTGYLLVRYPVVGAESLTLILASFLIVSGIFRAVGSTVIKFPRWGWALTAGIIAALLGIMLLVQMPVSAVWFIGFALGVDLIVDGAAMVGFATAIHGLPKERAYTAAA